MSVPSSRPLRSLSRRLATQQPGWLYSLGGTARRPVAERALAVADPDELLGVTAEPEWRGVALVLPARATSDPPHPAGGGLVRELATLAFALDRNGEAAVAVAFAGQVESLEPGAGVTGFLADVTARVLGLPTVPEPTDPSELIVRVWLQNLLDEAADPAAGGVGTWSAAVALHPAWRALGGPVPSPYDAVPDDVAEVTLALASRLPWSRMRRLAADAAIAVPGLAPSTAQWMDDPFFARWTLDVHRPSTELLDDLCLFIDGQVRRDVQYTVQAVSWLGFADSHAS